MSIVPESKRKRNYKNNKQKSKGAVMSVLYEKLNGRRGNQILASTDKEPDSSTDVSLYTKKKTSLSIYPVARYSGMAPSSTKVYRFQYPASLSFFVYKFSSPL